MSYRGLSSCDFNIVVQKPLYSIHETSVFAPNSLD
jgi:hypothetical protein